MPEHAGAALGGVISPAAPLGRALLGALFDAVAGTARPEYIAWRRLFGHVTGSGAGRLSRVLAALGVAHGRDYAADPPAYLFAAHTAVALVAKLAAGAVLPGGPGAGVAWLRRLETGEPFGAAGIEGFTGSDDFGWPLDEPSLAPVLDHLTDTITATAARVGLGRVWSGDLFTGAYQSAVPRELRHALGETYTPTRLAAHALDQIGWSPTNDLLDPTCGTGTFLLEALRRRLMGSRGPSPLAEVKEAAPPCTLVSGLYGIDINPLAVLSTKASLIVALAPHLAPSRPITLPVLLGDALDAHDVPRVGHMCGNPPWVKWSQLPPAYAEAIKPVCAGLGLFGDDRYVGGIETDLSAVITIASLARWLKPGGRLAFYITGSLFSTAAGQGFRRFAPGDPPGPCRVLAVEDFTALAPFEGVNAQPALLLLEAGGATTYPVPWLVHEPAGGVRSLLARPVPGTRDGPWLKGTAERHRLWERLFDGAAPSAYRARKGVTTDRNGIYFVSVMSASEPGLVTIANDPALGRREDLPRVTAEIEDTHVFPLLRGRGLAPFRAEVDAVSRVIVPQRGMHGDPDLARICPLTHAYLSRFESELITRGSYRRYQRGQPFWSVWSTGPYSFAPWKVLWREISSRFAAAYVGPVDDPVLGLRVAVPDHKLYFVALETEDEAAFLTGLLNAPSVVEAVSAYAAALSLGTSVIETLRIPRFDPAEPRHRELSDLARGITRAGGGVSAGHRADLDRLALTLLGAL